MKSRENKKIKFETVAAAPATMAIGKELEDVAMVADELIEEKKFP